MTPIERVLAQLPDAKTTKEGWKARCKAHEDHNPSLSIATTDDGRVLVHCHAGCKVEDVCGSLGLRTIDLMPTGDTVAKPPAKKSSADRKSKIVATYDYRDESGELVFQVIRYDSKKFRQRQPKNGGGWTWSVKGLPAIPYRLPEVLRNSKQFVAVVEGERDSDNLNRLNVLATCNAGGAGKWTPEHAKHLKEKNVVIFADNDKPGFNHARQVAYSLVGIAKAVRIIELPGLPEKGDVSDWLEAGGTADQLAEIIRETPEWEPGAEPWQTLESFDDCQLPAFPTHCLPEVLRKWVEAESLATQTPPALAALLALAVVSATIARFVDVNPRGDWVEPTNLFVAILLAPGNRKSAVFSDATAPLREIEKELIEDARPSHARNASKRRQDEKRLAMLEKRAAEKDDAAAGHQASELAARLDTEPKPVLPRLIVDDATSEKLGMILQEQGGRIASLSPEGGVFDLMAGLYSKSGIPQFGAYLMGHSGDAMATDRVSREAVQIERPALTCAYAMQPQVIEGLAENAAFRGRGLLARFLYSAPESWIGQRVIAPPPISDEIKQAYQQLIRRLSQSSVQHSLTLRADALVSLEEWEREIEEKLADGGDMEIVRDWGSKLAGATLRIAAALHCVKHGSAGAIDQTTISEAVQIAEYLIPHAEFVLNMMQASDNQAEQDAQYVLRWIIRGERTVFTRRDAQQHGKRRFPKAADIDAPLSDLVKRGYIRPLPSEASGSGPGRPASPSYEVNLAAFEQAKPRTRSQYSHNHADSVAKRSSENNENEIAKAQNENRVQVDL